MFNPSQDSEECKKSDRLMNALDIINIKMGRGTIQVGGRRVKAVCNLKRDFLSQYYTTRWNELLIVK